MAAPEYNQAHSLHEALNDPQAEAKCKKILKGFGFKESDFNKPAREYSGGWVLRAPLAQLLVIEPDYQPKKGQITAGLLARLDLVKDNQRSTPRTTPTGTIRLRPNRERSLARRHPWVFSGAIAAVDGSPAAGDTVRVCGADGTPLGLAAFSPADRKTVIEGVMTTLEGEEFFGIEFVGDPFSDDGSEEHP